MRRYGLVVIMLATWVALSGSKAQGNEQYDNWLLEPGKVDSVYIGNFAPRHLLGAFEALEANKRQQAAPVLAKAVAANSKDLASYVGMIQAKPSLWPGEIARLNRETAQNPHDPYLKCKLGAVLFHQWGSRRTNGSTWKKDPQLIRAKQLTEQAWDETHHPVAGLLVMEMADRPALNALFKWKVLNQLMAQIAGTPAFAQFQKAKTAKWKAEPPSINLVPREKRWELYGILQELRCMNDRRQEFPLIKDGKVVTKNGETVFFWDITEQERNDLHTYVDKWQKAIIKNP